LKINYDNTTRWYRHTLRVKKDGISKNVSNKKLREICQRGVLRSKWEHHVRKDITQKEE